MSQPLFQPIERQSLSQAVYERLRDGIVQGELSTGTKLPAERTLAETLGVNRGAVREALKRLEQAGLVAVRHGGAARVLDYRQTAGMDLLSELLFAGGDLNLDVARGVIEMRGALGPEIARRCAERGGEEAAARLRAIVADMERDPELGTRQLASMDFWTTLVEGSHNVAYRLAYNSMQATYGTFREALLQVMAPELNHVEGFRAIAEAVALGDAEGAARSAAALLELGAAGLRQLFESLEALTGEEQA